MSGVPAVFVVPLAAISVVDLGGDVEYQVGLSGTKSNADDRERSAPRA
jgi:hypothetical protein